MARANSSSIASTKHVSRESQKFTSMFQVSATHPRVEGGGTGSLKSQSGRGRSRRSVSRLIEAHKKAVTLARRLDEKLKQDYPEELRGFARIQVGRLLKGRDQYDPIYAYSAKDIDAQTKGHHDFYKSIGGRTYEQFCEEIRSLKAEFAVIEGSHVQQQKHTGYTKAKRAAVRASRMAWRALYEITRVAPASRGELAAVSRYLRMLRNRDELSDYFLARFMNSLAHAHGGTA